MKNDRELLVRDIEKTFAEVSAVLSKFDSKTLNEIPFPGSWTAGQTAEHIIICSSGIPDKNTCEPNRPYDQKVGEIKDLFLNFNLKFKTDPSLAPGPPTHDKEKLLRQINDNKNQLKATAENRKLDELCTDMELPSFGNLTRFEWLRFILFHTQRHIHQILGIVEADGIRID